MLTCLRVFLEDLLIQSVAFPFRVLILYAKFTQSRFVFIKKIHFFELKICPKYLTEILKVLTESFFVEVFLPKLFVINVDVFTFMCRCFITEKKSKKLAFKFQKGKACVQCKKEHLLVN